MKKTLLVAAMLMSLLLALLLSQVSSVHYTAILLASICFACLSLLTAVYLRKRTEPRSAKLILDAVVLIGAAVVCEDMLRLVFEFRFMDMYYLLSGKM